MNNEEMILAMLEKHAALLETLAADVAGLKQGQTKAETALNTLLPQVDESVDYLAVIRANGRTQDANISRVFSRLEKLDEGQVELKQGQVEANQRLSTIEADITVIKEDTHFLRRLSDEAFKDIHMLDKRTKSLKIVK